MDHPVAEVDRSGGDRRTVGQSDGVPRDLERAVRERRALGQVQGPVAELEAAVRQRDRARRQWRDLDVARAPEAGHDVADLGQARAGALEEVRRRVDEAARLVREGQGAFAATAALPAPETPPPAPPVKTVVRTLKLKRQY
ncbi:hypothetical protein [Streptomyces anulatus]|uniref:hypothetical protein n=1 Tax=Streptomyces anulatus TaxID=1892 RepID=UPI003862F85B